MDDRELSKAKENLKRLDRALADLAVKQRRVEKQLADGHDAVRKCAAQRVGVVSQLVDAAPEQATKLHRQLDSLDSQIRGSERMSESYQALLRSIASETADVTSERDKLNQLVAAENTTRQFQDWKIQLAEVRRTAEGAFASARLALAALDSLCASGGERFGGAAFNLAASTFEDLLTREANLEMNGWKLSTPVYRADAIIHVRPLVRR